MVRDCLRLLGRRRIRRLATVGTLREWSRCLSQEFDGELEHLQEPRVSESEVNKRLTGHELNFTASSRSLSFSANQVGVNRPVEDRWSAYQFGADPNHPSPHVLWTDKFKDVSGGTIFSVLDGHGGQACAHALNLLHADYLTVSLLPLEVAEQVLRELRSLAESQVPYSVFELCETLWSSSEALVTGESAYVGPPRPQLKTDSEMGAAVDSRPRWTSWGPWGPMAASVRDVHLGHLRKILEETLSCSFEDNMSYFDDNTHGDLYDAEGFLVASVRHLQDAINNKKKEDAPLIGSNHTATTSIRPPPLSFSQSSSTPGATDTTANLFNSDLVQLHGQVSAMSSTIRNSLRRMDLDLSAAAQPSRGGPMLDKALLRIVFSGCVATTAYIPRNANELYVAQVGDCAAVLGSYVPDAHSSGPSEYSPLDWKAELLIDPHNSENDADVQRLKANHPIHEEGFLLREDRLLGELMPLRAFGDIRFKWPADELKHVARMLDLPPNYPIMPSFYTTPPYLCSTPQIVWRPLVQQREHFLILATDGLWDMLSPKEAMNVVAKHWFDYQCDPTYCGPGDTAASRLIRTALGGEDMDPHRISVHFSIPSSVARYYRDDITVIVVYLPTAFAPNMR